MDLGIAYTFLDASRMTIDIRYIELTVAHGWNNHSIVKLNQQ